jgi:hypothetical protein
MQSEVSLHLSYAQWVHRHWLNTIANDQYRSDTNTICSLHKTNKQLLQVDRSTQNCNRRSSTVYTPHWTRPSNRWSSSTQDCHKTHFNIIFTLRQSIQTATPYRCSNQNTAGACISPSPYGCYSYIQSSVSSLISSPCLHESLSILMCPPPPIQIASVPVVARSEA